MLRFSVLLSTILISIQVWAQSTPGDQNLTFQISGAKPWVDTGIDLQAGDVVKISASAVPTGQSVSDVPSCNPVGVATASSNSTALPLPGAPLAALIARLHGETSTPVLIGNATELQIDQASHLLLGMNTAASSVCQGGLAVQVQRIRAGSLPATQSPQQATRGQQLKSQVLNAAQIFMQGQFGVGKGEAAGSGASSSATSSTSETTATPALALSTTPLDTELIAHLDSLPRRVNDQLNNLGDMVNFVIVGDQKEVQSALEAASWHVADTSNANAVVNAIEQTYNSKDYLAMPMSVLFLFGRKQDFGYELAEPIAMVASRHHFRLWKAPFAWNGKEVWVGAGTHDIGFAKDKRNNNVTHKIDPAVDAERDNIGSTLQKSNRVRSLTYYLPTNPVKEARNATGDGYQSDGRLLVVFLP